MHLVRSRVALDGDVGMVIQPNGTCAHLTSEGLCKCQRMFSEKACIQLETLPVLFWRPNNTKSSSHQSSDDSGSDLPFRSDLALQAKAMQSAAHALPKMAKRK